MIGTTIAHYEINSHIGSGGMGDVYQATDTRLGRGVAIKFLPEGFSHDSDRVARFQREARVLASLNHANIAAIYGFEEINGRHFLIMELVPGETLADRIRRGAIPFEEAMPIAKQILEALEEAHEKGIIHRDLKPANIKVTPQGQVKVLDFGLAKAFEADVANTNLSNSPTLSVGATHAGMILGTASYMSPEQAKGRVVGTRTDIFAFGCVLYEMLSGKQAFAGEDITEILSRVLQREPDWTLLPSSLPPAVIRTLRLCLEKDARKRRGTAGDVRIDLEQAETRPANAERVPERRRVSLAWVAAALFAIAAGGAFWLWFRDKASRPSEMQVEISTPTGEGWGSAFSPGIAFSPDGQEIAFIVRVNGLSQIWVRSLQSREGKALPGTEGAMAPFWSPDGASIGFTARGKLKRIEVATGAIEALSDASLFEQGGTWAPDGTILFVGTTNSPILRVPASGGNAVPATQLRPGEDTGHFDPQFLPDGVHFTYRATTNPDGQEIYVGSLKGSEVKKLLAAEYAVYARSHLFFLRSGKLFAQPFDPGQLVLSGTPVELAQNVAERSLSVSALGAITYRTRTGQTQYQVQWFDRSGKEGPKVGSPDDVYRGDSLPSPDGSSVAMTRVVSSGHADIWLIDTMRGILSRFTTDPADDTNAIWSPDGKQIAFFSARNDKRFGGLYRKSLNGAPGSEELVLEGTQRYRPFDLSPDGHTILYGEVGARTNVDIWAAPIGGTGKPFPVAQTPSNEFGGRFSPDGKWIAYESDESGRFEIYVQPFMGSGNKWQVSTQGGIDARWRTDGKELFFRSSSGQFMAVSIQLDPNTPAVHAGTPAMLFGLPAGLGYNGYGATGDGQRFLVDTTIDPPLSPIHLILNWNGL